jgi:hypothetical protein
MLFEGEIVEKVVGCANHPNIQMEMEFTKNNTGKPLFQTWHLQSWP